MAWTPGAFEIPTVAGRLAASGQYAAVMCLGAVVRGETSHDQHINQAVSTALCQLGVRYQLPVLFGILTCNTLEQAIARSGGQQATTGKDAPQAHLGNKGVDCAPGRAGNGQPDGQAEGERGDGRANSGDQLGGPGFFIHHSPFINSFMSRSRAREVAFQVLYQDDLNLRNSPAELDRWLEGRLAPR